VRWLAASVVVVAIAGALFARTPWRPSSAPLAGVAPGTLPRAPGAVGVASAATVKVTADSAPPTVRLEIHTVPAAAKVYLAEQLLGPSDAPLELGKGAAPIRLRVEAPGYLARELTITPDRDQVSIVRLHPRPKPGDARPRPLKSLRDELAF